MYKFTRKNIESTIYCHFPINSYANHINIEFENETLAFFVNSVVVDKYGYHGTLEYMNKGTTITIAGFIDSLLEQNIKSIIQITVDACEELTKLGMKPSLTRLIIFKIA